MASTVLLPFVFAELPFPSLTSVDPSLLTFTEALESVEEDSLVTLLDDGVEDDVWGCVELSNEEFFTIINQAYGLMEGEERT